MSSGIYVWNYSRIVCITNIIFVYYQTIATDSQSLPCFLTDSIGLLLSKGFQALPAASTAEKTLSDNSEY